MSARPRVVVTRPVSGGDTLAERLSELGFEVVAAPAIEIGPPRSYDALDRLARDPSSADWLIFLSRNGVRHFVQRCRRYRTGGTPVPPAVRVAVVGDATAAMARRAEIPVALACDGRTALDLAAAVIKRANPSDRLVVVQAEGGSPDAVDTLRVAGFDVRAVPAYRTRSARVPDDILLAIRNAAVAAVAFASPSSARSLAIALGGLRNIPSTVCVGAIGPTTADALAQAGRRADVVAAQSSGAALAEAIAQDLQARQPLRSDRMAVEDRCDA
jgi:uroporphyrinogen-III synthase